jgi:hypothetical protein
MRCLLSSHGGLVSSTVGHGSASSRATSGYVRWEHETNRGFLRALDGLRRAAANIGEIDEEERCAEFLHQLEPGWDRLERDEPE